MKTLKAAEHQIQKAMVQWLHLQEKQSRLRFFHVPNEGRRTARYGDSLKKLGLRAGVPDLCVIFTDGDVWWIEVKSATGNVSNLQRWWLDWMADRPGHSAFIMRSLDELQKAVVHKLKEGQR